jgi:hypothetical protein
MPYSISLYFGLPLTFNYSDIFQELGCKDDFQLSDIDECIDNLEQAAKIYLLGPVKTDLELLKIDQEMQTEIDLVLPELTLKLLPESYYFFCYNFLFLKKIITPTSFLKELKLVVKYDCSNKLTKLALNRSHRYKLTADYIELKTIGLNFLDIYIRNYDRLNNDEDDLPF